SDTRGGRYGRASERRWTAPRGGAKIFGMLDRDSSVDRQHHDVKERADRALRAGNAAEALPLYTSLLRQVKVLEAGVYDSWLEGAAAAYRALGRTREAGYALLALRRFTEAERCFTPERDPHAWALCAAS